MVRDTQHKLHYARNACTDSFLGLGAGMIMTIYYGI